MGDYGQIIGVRILVKLPQDNDYLVQFEFKGDNWQKRALRVISEYIGVDRVKIQTLHPFSTSYHLQTGQIQEPGDIWIDNPYFTVDNLFNLNYNN